MTMKVCATCGESKPVSDFYRNRTMADGRQTSCRPCEQARMREYYAERKLRGLSTPSGAKKVRPDSGVDLERVLRIAFHKAREAS